VNTLAAIAAAMLLAGAQVPGKGPAPVKDQDAEIVENLELLERLDLLDHLEVLEPAPSRAPEEPPAEPPTEKPAPSPPKK
jgi:hypothetical protein